MSTLRLSFSSDLPATADEVWAHASTMDGVNAELGPWIRMTVPRAARGKGLADVEVGREAFASVLMLFGVLPFDLHHLTRRADDRRLRGHRSFDDSASIGAQVLARTHRTTPLRGASREAAPDVRRRPHADRDVLKG
jgi:hypothetical protein